MNPANSPNPLIQGAAVSSANPAQPSASQAGNLTPDLVSNIPVKMPDGPPSAPLKEDGELDEIMRDVTHELRREDQRPPKKRLGLFGGKTKTLKPVAPSAQPAQSKPTASPVAQTKSAPVLVITLAILVTGVLLAAAYLTYKK